MTVPKNKVLASSLTLPLRVDIYYFVVGRISFYGAFAELNQVNILWLLCKSREYFLLCWAFIEWRPLRLTSLDDDH